MPTRIVAGNRTEIISNSGIEPYRRLGLAIIQQAVLDWEYLVRKKVWRNDVPYSRTNLAELREFFTSGWFDSLLPISDEISAAELFAILERLLATSKAADIAGEKAQ